MTAINRDRHYTTCGKCGGTAYEQREMFGLEEFTGVWLHLNATDWQDDPHNVEVTGVRVVTDRRSA